MVLEVRFLPTPLSVWLDAMIQERKEPEPMTENTTTLETEGLMARNIASNVLDSLGLAASEVQQMEVVLRTLNEASEDNKSTNTSFQTSGADAGSIAQSMLGAVDDEQHQPEYINVEVTTHLEEDSTDESTQADLPEATDGDDRRNTEAFSMPDDFGTEESPATSVVPLSQDSTLHITLATLASYEAKYPNDKGVVPRELWESVETIPVDNMKTLSSSMSKLFRDKGYFDRNKETQPDTGGIRCRYWMDNAAWEELQRLGWPEDMEPIDGQPDTIEDHVQIVNEADD